MRSKMKKLCKIIVISVLVLALMSCNTITLKSTETPAPIATSLPTLTSTPEPIITPKSTETPILNPIVVNAHSFMDPILKSVTSRPPDYQDNFSNPTSGWPSGRQPAAGHDEGILGYENDEYFITADAAKFIFEEDPAMKITCLSAFHSPSVKVLDFVMEVDARFVTFTEFGDWQMKFWKESTYYYGVRMTQEERGRVSFHTNFPIQEYLDSKDLLETELIPSFNLSGGINHLVVVAKDSQIAMTLNDRVVVYIDNLPPHELGQIGFGVCNFGIVPFRSQWDNLKIWNLSK
jgi:hypothetical protein